MTTIKEASQKWVNGMNAIPQGLLEKAYGENIDEWQEVTKPTVGSRIWSNDLQGGFEVIRVEDDKVFIENDDEKEESLDIDNIHLEQDSWLPMWGWLWIPEGIDQEWIESNLQAVSDCGFRVFETDETGIIIGIDGAGYDFYTDHWIPFYKVRGLHWHDEE